MIALTKVDKLRAKEREQLNKRVTTPLGVEPEQTVPCSAKTGEGRDEILDAMSALLAPAVEQLEGTEDDG